MISICIFSALLFFGGFRLSVGLVLEIWFSYFQDWFVDGQGLN
jgi:hypothetical protein